MGNAIEVSPSGRAKCRSCKESVPKGELRFAEAYDSPYSDGESFRYYHLLCAAKKVPLLVKTALPTYTGDVPNRAEVDQAIEDASKKGKGGKLPLPHADLAPTGRAKCIACSEPLEKGKVRVAVEREVEGLMGKSAGYLHPGCAIGWAEEAGDDTAAFADTVLANSATLTDEERESLSALFGAESPE